jgi:FkbM family methyltransferase
MSSDPRAMLPQSVPSTGAQLASAILGERSAIVLDVGARWGAENAWWRLSPLAKLIGFEPDASECERLNALHGDRHADEYVPLALSDSCGTATLYVTSEPACSSLYPPDERLVERYPDLADIRPSREVAVSSVTLDAWIDTRPEALDAMAFMKLDVQGAELKVLRGASRVLGKCAGVEVEVEFNPMYRGQPLFAEVDALLRSAGFSLWRLSDLCHYAESCEGRSRGLGSTHYGGLNVAFEEGDGRLYWANALYLRDYAELPLDGGFTRTSLWLAALMEARRDLAGARACLERLLTLAANLGDAERHAIRNHLAAISSRQATHRTRKALKEIINQLIQENSGLRAELAKHAWPKF